jgi:hypothetical protein
MWPFKKKVKKVHVAKEYEYVKSEIVNVKVKNYDAKIYNEAGNVIGEACFTDDIFLYNREGYACWGEDLPVKAGVNQDNYYRFQHFLQHNLLIFEDYDGNKVSMSTDIIKKIAISVFDEVEEEVQLYKYVEVC